MFEQLAPQSLVFLYLSVIEHHIQTDDTAVQTLISHQDGQSDQGVAVAVVFQRQQYLLVVARLVIFVDDIILKHDFLRGKLRHQGRNDAGEEYHHHHTVEHIGIHQVAAVADAEFHTHHHDGNGACCVGRSQAEHHVPIRYRHAESDTRQIAGNHLSDCSHHHHDNDHIGGVPTLKEHADIDEHSHTNQEIGNEDGIADKLQTSHQRGDTRNVAVEGETGKEGAKHTFESDKRRDGSTEEKDGKDEDKLRDGITVSLQEPARHPWHDVYHTRQIDSQFQQRQEKCVENRR